MYIGVISALIGGLVAAITVHISNKKTMKNKIPGNINKDGYVVMKAKSNNKLVTYISFIFGTAFTCFSLSLLISNTSNTPDDLLMVALGVFFILLGFFWVKFTNDNRIEYNDEEIKQYRMMRKKVKVIKWDELLSGEDKNIGPLLSLRSEEVEIFVDLRFDGSIQFLEFLSERESKNGQ